MCLLLIGLLLLKIPLINLLKKIRNKFFLTSSWFLYITLGIYYPFIFTKIIFWDYWNTTARQFQIIYFCFPIIHYLALRISKLIGLRKSNIFFLKDPYLYVNFVLIYFLITFNEPFTNIQGPSVTSSAMNTIATIAKECNAKIVDLGVGAGATFVVPENTFYSGRKGGFFIGKKKLVPGSLSSCSYKNYYQMVSIDEKRFPNIGYDPSTASKFCSHNGPTEKMYGCSARNNGEW